MSRNRIADLPSTSNPYYTRPETQEYGQNNADLERNDLVAGQQYELQDRQISLNEYRNDIQDAKEATSRLDAQLTRIQQLQTQSLAAADGAPTAELDSLVASTSSVINSIKANLDRLANDARKGGPEAKQKLTLVNSQRTQLQQRVQRFRIIEQGYNDKLRERAIRQYRIVNPEVTEEELSSALSDPNTQIFQQALMSSTRSSQATSTLSQVQARHNDIVAIERKVAELAQLFQELELTINLQEVHIDRIDDQAGKAQNNLSSADKELDRTIGIMKAIRRKKWWCFFICVLIVVIVIVVPVVITHTKS